MASLDDMMESHLTEIGRIAFRWAELDAKMYAVLHDRLGLHAESDTLRKRGNGSARLKFFFEKIKELHGIDDTEKAIFWLL